MYIDSGANGNMYGGHYFDSNEEHMIGKLKFFNETQLYDAHKLSKLVLRASIDGQY